ncbi:MAG: L,D-transpeptidase [Pseudolabrys sp.]|nr:L,D-transpeptidase [Pseudolabrys sp.]
MTNLRLWLKSFVVAGALALSALLPASARDVVGFGGGYHPGTIVIVTHSRELYYVLGQGQAIRYPVGVGKAGMAWHGRAQIAEKFLRPAWGPPADIALANPRIPLVIPGGSPRNPMGAAAMGLNRGNYAIHGTNDPGSIGRYVSHGCIRMHNEDILDLYRRAPIGTEVFVLR